MLFVCLKKIYAALSSWRQYIEDSCRCKKQASFKFEMKFDEIWNLSSMIQQAVYLR